MEVWLHGGLGLGECNTRLQTCENIYPAAAAAFQIVPQRRDLRLHHHRKAHLRILSDLDAREAILADADDRIAVIVDDHVLADYSAIQPEAALPEGVADHGYRMRALLQVVVLCQEPSGCGID